MKKIFLSAVGFSLLCRLNAYSQIKQDSVINKPSVSLNSAHQDSTAYKARRLRIDEIDFVSSYYNQNGDHSAVTGGIGTEKVTDISNGLDLKLVWLNTALNKNTLSVGFGYDHHTSASQAFVSQTGASKTGGDRIYPSLDWTIENAKNGNTFGIGTYYSGEFNYQSLGADAYFSIKTDNKMGEFSAKLQGYFDHVTLIYPSEFRPQSANDSTGNFTNGHQGERDYGSSPRNTYTASLSYSQIINSRLQVMFLADAVTQNGYLGLPFHRVYFSNGKDTIEKLPASRFKLPVGFRASYFLGDNIILRAYYRYYLDNWGTKSNTANLEIAYKITPFFSISPFYRYYNQSAAKYFAPYEGHSINDEYYTSNYEYAKFQSSFFGAGFRIAPPAGVFGWQNLHELELRYGHYTQTTNLASDVISLSLAFK